MNKDLIIIRGGGDLATGVIQKFFRAGLKILVLETERPTTIRRTVALSSAVFENKAKVEDLEAVKISDISEIDNCFNQNLVPIYVDESGKSIEELKPAAVVDAIIAKKNLGTNKSMAGITIAIGPGFVAGQDVDIVIESMRGHDLGRLIFSGAAFPNTNIPGDIAGKSAERVVHSPNSGIVRHVKKIGDIVAKGEILFYVGDTEVISPLDGLLRGLISENLYVKKGLKVADVDPRKDVDWNTISDKARCLGGSALEAYLYLRRKLDR